MSKQKPNELNVSAILSGTEAPPVLFDAHGAPVLTGPAQMLGVPSLEDRALFAKSNETNRKIMLAKNWLRQNSLDIAQAFIKRRFMDALVLYRALPPALAFHRSKAHNRLIVGSNKCLAGSERIYDPIAQRHRRIDEIDSQFHVWSVNPRTGRKTISLAMIPFIKGEEELYRITLSNGHSFLAADKHVLAIPQHPFWITVSRVSQRLRESGPIRLRSSEESFLGAFPRDVRHSIGTALDSQCDCPACHRLRDEQLREVQDTVQDSAPSPNDAPERIYDPLRADALVSTREHTHLGQSPCRHSICDANGHCARRFVEFGIYAFGNICRLIAAAFRASDQFLHKSFHQLRTTAASVQRAIYSACVEPGRLLASSDTQSSLESCQPKLQFATTPFQIDKVQRSDYEAQGFVDLPCDSPCAENMPLFVVGVNKAGREKYYDFHVPGTNNYVHCGAVHHNSGKTVSAGFEAASKVLGRHPLRPKKNGWLLCVGLDEDHISHMWGDILTKEGLFEIVPDEITGAPRAVRPDPNDPKHIDPIDLDRQELWQPSPPFIPREEWDWPGGHVWRDKGKNAPAIIRLKSTGWKMTFHPSGGVPKRGIAITDAWFDEEIANMLWITETIPRLVKDDGYFVWSATPQTASEELVKMHSRVLRGEDDIEEFTLYLEDNPYITDAAKKRMYDSIAAYGDEELAVRYFGEWAVYGRKIYPQWDMNRLGTDEWQ